jgi:hypothetical protein
MKTNDDKYYVVDENGHVVQRGLSIVNALALCYQHREYSICKWKDGNLSVLPKRRVVQAA